jgi:hypothetical protein
MFIKVKRPPLASLADAPIRPKRVMPMSTWVAPEVVEPPDAFDQAQQQQQQQQ